MDPNLGLPLQPPPPLNFAEFGAPVWRHLVMTSQHNQIAVCSARTVQMWTWEHAEIFVGGGGASLKRSPPRSNDIAPTRRKNAPSPYRDFSQAGVAPSLESGPPSLLTPLRAPMHGCVVFLWSFFIHSPPTYRTVLGGFVENVPEYKKV